MMEPGAKGHVVWISRIVHVGFVSKHQHGSSPLRPPVRAWRLGQKLQTELQISRWGFFGQEYPLREKEALDGPKVNFENVASVFPSNEPSVYQSNLT